jgi:hypothetical protein
MSEQDYLREIRDKLDENLKATAEVKQDIAVLSKAVEGHDRANEEYKSRTDKTLERYGSMFDDVYDRISGVEKVVNADSQNRTDMATFRTSSIRWVVATLGGIILMFGGGVAVIAYQVSKINGVG